MASTDSLSEQIYRMAYHTLGLPDGLLCVFNDMVWRVFWPADDDGPLGGDSHGKGSEKRNQQRQKCKAHGSDGDGRYMCEMGLLLSV